MKVCARNERKVCIVLSIGFNHVRIASYVIGNLYWFCIFRTAIPERAKYSIWEKEVPHFVIIQRSSSCFLHTRKSELCLFASHAVFLPFRGSAIQDVIGNQLMGRLISLVSRIFLNPGTVKWERGLNVSMEFLEWDLQGNCTMLAL